MLSISGSDAFVLIKELKSKYGVKQKSIADVLGISRQAVTDMKAERRRFTREMAEKLLTEYASEPWAGWLRMRLDALFTPPPTRFSISDDLPPRDEEDTGTETLSQSVVFLPHSTRQSGLPVLTSPWRGSPELSPANTRKSSVIPDELSTQITKWSDSYILIIDFDSRDGRLRRGDRVLVLQDADRECEIMLIAYRGAVRLAQRGKYERILNRDMESEVSEMDWVSLDSGAVIPGSEAEVAGCVIGIVMALL